MGVFSGAEILPIPGFQDHSARPSAVRIFGKNMFPSTFRFDFGRGIQLLTNLSLSLHRNSNRRMPRSGRKQLNYKSSMFS